MVTAITLHNIYAIDHLFAKSDPIWLLLLSAHASNMAKLEKGGKGSFVLWNATPSKYNLLNPIYVEKWNEKKARLSISQMEPANHLT